MDPTGMFLLVVLANLIGNMLELYSASTVERSLHGSERMRYGGPYGEQLISYVEDHSLVL